MTITELQAFIDTKPDVRQIINEIVDYLEASPGGAVDTIYTADGSLAGDRTIDLNGHSLSLDDLIISKPDSLTMQIKGADNDSPSHGTDLNIIGGDSSDLGARGGNINLMPGDGNDSIGRVKILNPDNNFSAIFDVGSLTNDHSYAFPNANGAFMIGSLDNGIQRIPYVDADGITLTTNEDFTWDEENLILGIGALGGEATLKARHPASNIDTVYNGIDLKLIAEDGGSTSGNGGNIIIGAGDGVAGDGNGGNINLIPGSKNGSGIIGQIFLSAPEADPAINGAIWWNANILTRSTA